MYKIYVGSHTYYTDASEKTIRKAMIVYIKERLASGMHLSEVVFTYARVRFVPHQAILKRFWA
jgi:hypothetical protein